MMRCRKFVLPKDGNPPDLMEDEYSVYEDEEKGVIRCAVADGATESYAAGFWARMLTEAYCHGLFEPECFEGNLAELQTEWSEEVDARVLPWFAEEKARSGAFATLVGLSLDTARTEDGRRVWRALAVGDSCLFHYRGRQLVYFMPVKNVWEFSNSPYLISSRPRNNLGLSERLLRVEGDWLPGDHFVLMTDALSCWLLQSECSERSLPAVESALPEAITRRAIEIAVPEAIARPATEIAVPEAIARPATETETVNPLASLSPLAEIEALTEESFVSWVGEKRRARQANGRPVLKNDDVTVLHLVLCED